MMSDELGNNLAGCHRVHLRVHQVQHVYKIQRVINALSRHRREKVSCVCDVGHLVKSGRAVHINKQIRSEPLSSPVQ